MLWVLLGSSLVVLAHSWWLRRQANRRFAEAREKCALAEALLLSVERDLAECRRINAESSELAAAARSIVGP